MQHKTIRFFGVWTILMGFIIVWNVIFKGHADYFHAGVTSLIVSIAIFIYLHYEEKQK